MNKWLIVYYRPMSGSAIQADLVPASQPISVYSELLGVEVLEGEWSQLQACALERAINRGLRFALEH